MAAARSSPAVKVSPKPIVEAGRGTKGVGTQSTLQPDVAARGGLEDFVTNGPRAAQWLLLQERRPCVLAAYEDVRGQHAQLLLATSAYQGHDARGTAGSERPRRLGAGASHLHSVRAEGPRPTSPGLLANPRTTLRHAPRAGACPPPRPALRPGHSLCPLASAGHAARRRS